MKIINLKIKPKSMTHIGKRRTDTNRPIKIVTKSRCYRIFNY